MDKINEMKARKAQIVTESRALHRLKLKEGITEERASYDKMFADNSNQCKIKDEERLPRRS